MSIEEPKANINPAMEKKDEQKAAIDLMNGNDLLREDELTKSVVYAGGSVDGKELDLLDFLFARQATLEMEKAEGKVAAAKTRNPQAWQVANSVRPDLENNLEN